MYSIYYLSFVTKVRKLNTLFFFSCLLFCNYLYCHLHLWLYQCPINVVLMIICMLVMVEVMWSNYHFLCTSPHCSHVMDTSSASRRQKNMFLPNNNVAPPQKKLTLFRKNDIHDWTGLVLQAICVLKLTMAWAWDIFEFITMDSLFTVTLFWLCCLGLWLQPPLKQ